jgi:phage terminase small subunit
MLIEIIFIESLKKPKVEEEVIEESRGSQLLKNELSAMKARQIVAFTADTDETKSPAHVRRTIRVIEQELNSRIEMLKTSQPDMEDFLARIQQYKDEHRRKAKKDIIVSNCARVKQFKREVRLEMLHKRVNFLYLTDIPTIAVHM